MTDVAERKSMLERLKQCVAQCGWRCLSDSWVGAHAPYRFVCARGHEFERNATKLLYRSGNAPVCTVCEQDDVRDRWLGKVAERGGTLLNGPFTGLVKRYRLRCVVGHEWDTSGRKIAEGRWCAVCGHAKKARRNRHSDGLVRLQAAAQAKGGRCLATDYTVGDRKYGFECAGGHRWEATGYNIWRGKWCRRCANSVTAWQIDPNGLARLQAAARERDGVCLATTYCGVTSKYPFRCAVGHEWQAVASHVYAGNWCRWCAYLKLRSTIEDMQALAATRGGHCLSSEYLGQRVQLTWQCHLGHVWETRPRNVREGKWCPQCAILDRVRARNSWKRRRYQSTDKLNTLPTSTAILHAEADQADDDASASITRSIK